MEVHPYGWLSLAPPVVAVVAAIVTRRILPSLLLGLLVGALITAHGNPFVALIALCEVHLWDTLIDPEKLRVSAFTLLIGATIGVIHASGAMRGLIECIAPLAKTRRTGQIGAWLMGLVIFFDDYANCLLLGTTLAPVCDRLKISREKLAYIVDSTAAPVAGLALVSTWIAVELDYLREGLSNLPAGEGAGVSPFDLFIACIPYRFYVIQTLILVFLIAWLGRDFGPMLRAERRCVAKQDPAGDSDQLPRVGQAGWEGDRVDHGPRPGSQESEPLPPTGEGAGEGRASSLSAPWWAGAVPILVTLGLVLGLIYWTGKRHLEASGSQERMLLRDIFGAGDSPLALMYGALGGLVVAIGLSSWLKLLRGDRVWQAASRGASFVLPALAILWFASAMSRMTSNKASDGRTASVAYEFQDHRLYAGDFLRSKLLEWNDSREGDGALKRWLPTIVFIMASVVSFCTGTSFGTMGILTPMVVPLAYAAVGGNAIPLPFDDPIFLCTLGSVLAGSIFGDHCSPISDTTILSSQASGCDHLAHVQTQMPYALLGGGVSILLGTVAVGWGLSVWILLPLQTFSMILCLYWLGKPVELPVDKRGGVA